MSRKTLARPPEQGQPSTSSLMFRRRDFGSSDQLHSWESSTPEAMDSDNAYTLVLGRRMKKKMRQMSSEQTSSNEREQRSFMVSYVPLTASHNLNSLSRQFLYEYIESVAPGQVNEIRINSRKKRPDGRCQEFNYNTLSGIPVRSFTIYGKESTTGVISDVDLDIKDGDLRNLLSSSVHILEFHRLGNSRCIKLVFASSTLPMTVKVGYVIHRVRPFVPRPLQCRKCLKIGHVSAVCRNQVTCQRCGGQHDTADCDAPSLKCPNCPGSHEATSKDCPKMQQEVRILRKMAKNKSSHRQAAQSLRRDRQRSRKERHPMTSEELDCGAQGPRQPLPVPASRTVTAPTANSGSPSAQGAHSSPLGGTDTEWPSLPSISTGTIPCRSVPLRQEVDSRASKADDPIGKQGAEKNDKESVEKMLKHLLESMRVILCGLQTPAAQSAVHVLAVLEQLIAALYIF